MTDDPAFPISLFRTIDFETTGIPTEEERHAVCEVGACDVRLVDGVWTVDDRPTAMLVNPGRQMPLEAMAVHHITDADLVDAPPVTDGFRLLMSGMDPATSCFVAHNADFERQFFGGGDVPWLCTWKCALRRFPDAASHGNQFLRYYLSAAVDPAIAMPPHRAGPDAYVTAHVLKRILDDGADIAEMIRWSTGHALLPRCPLFKHKGKKWEDVPTDYLDWIVNKPNDVGADVKANAKLWLKKREAA